MTDDLLDRFPLDVFYRLFKPHPWHGVPLGDGAPELLHAFIEIVPTDPVKYELDKWSGHLRVDRPQRFSSMCPTLYGFIPQTYCGRAVAELCEQRTGRTGIEVRPGATEQLVVIARPVAAEPGRGTGTVRAIERHLMEDGFVRRYEVGADDGLPPGEGVFLPSSSSDERNARSLASCAAVMFPAALRTSAGTGECWARGEATKATTRTTRINWGIDRTSRGDPEGR